MLEKFILSCKHIVSRVLHAYADIRIGATEAEKHCYKTSETILLTFDDFAEPERVEAILAVLQEKQVKSMFFLQGDWALQHPALLERMRVDGHYIGNHTLTHRVLRDEPKEIIVQEIVDAKLDKPWLRPPQGRYDKRVRAIAHELGYVICYWTIDSNDWAGTSTVEMEHTILSELEAGAVILLHLNGAHTLELLPGIIDKIRAKGYTLTPPEESWTVDV